MSYLPQLSKEPSFPTLPRVMSDLDEKDLKIDTCSEPPQELVSSSLSGFNVFAEGNERIAWLLWGFVCCTGISSLLFGYDTGVLPGALSYIGKAFGGVELDDDQTDLITSSTTVGALVGGLLAPLLSDYTGRKWLLAVGSFLFLAGSVCQALSNTLWTLLAGRFVAGIGVGAGAAIAPLYTQELAPTRVRGRLTVLTIAFVPLGQIIGSGLAAALADVPRSWRWLFGGGAVLAALQLFLLSYLPESPRILIRRGEVAAAEVHMARIYADATSEDIAVKIQALQNAVKASVEIHKRTTFWQRVCSIFRVSSNRRSLIVACGLQALQQLCGFNTLMYYSASIFGAIGFKKPVIVGTIVAATNLVFTLFAMRLVDHPRVGRRRVLLWSIPVMCAGLVLTAVSLHFMTRYSGGHLRGSHSFNRAWSGTILGAMIVYIAGYAVGLGNVPWLQAELFTLDVRGIGVALATATNWGSSLMITATYSSMMHSMTSSGTFGLYAGLVVLGYVFVWACYPESAGLSLEEVRLVFAENFGVAKAQALRVEKTALYQRLASGQQAVRHQMRAPPALQSPISVYSTPFSMRTTREPESPATPWSQREPSTPWSQREPSTPWSQQAPMMPWSQQAPSTPRT